MVRFGFRALAPLLAIVLAMWGVAGAAAAQTKQASLPWGETKFGKSVFELQIMLDRARFSPGILDGRWGQNTETALYYLMKREGLVDKNATKDDLSVDEKAYARIKQLAGNPGSIVKQHALTEQDVSGPFVTIPDGIYEKEDMDCLCYSSLEEKLAELFHTSPDVLAELNPNVTLGKVKAGDTIVVPNVSRLEPTGMKVDDAPQIAKIVVSDEEHFVQAHDADGRIVYHFPSTLGSQFSPSPEGSFSVTAIAYDPTWHFQPDLLGEEGYSRDAMIPGGPNNPVGLVWMDLSKPHYGIHGTNAPDTIGYAESHGCVRLTNWDAVFLAHRIDKGVDVEFTNVD